MKFLTITRTGLFLYLSLFVVTIFIISCSDSTSPENDQGQIKITMVDAPAGFDQVNIVVTKVEVHKAGSDSSSGWIVINENAETYNLLTLRNGASAIVGNSSLDAGHYTQIRLIIGTGSNIVVNGVVFSLDVSGGAQTGVKLNKEFEIQQGLVYELTLDFDAGNSIILTGNGQYKLQPVIRVIPAVISGTISGRIVPLSSEAIIYAISGTDEVSATAEITTGSFKIMAVVEGNYNVKVLPTNILYNDTTITNITVAAKQNTDLGIINLRQK